MRDILTVIASLVILVLAAALAVPPLVDWESRRDAIDRAVARAAGVEARTEGRIVVRLLPSPRIRVDHLVLGRPDGTTPSLSARFVKAEVALTPLLSGQVRFTETRVGRAEVRVPTGPGGRWTLPEGGLDGEGFRREWAFEDLSVQQLLVTSQTPSTGRTDQFYAEGVQIQGQSLAGPWRVEGTTRGVPFRLATGEFGPDRTIRAKLTGGGDASPRFEIDARLDLAASGGRPAIQGTARLLFGPPAQAAAAGLPIPVQIQTTFRSAPGAVLLDPFSLEAGEGGASLRVAGTGRVGLEDLGLSLKLEGRRLDVDSFILSATGREFLARARDWNPPRSNAPLDLDLKLNSVGLAQEELQDVVFRGGFARGRVRVELLELTAPGDTRIAASGAFGLATEGGAQGRLALRSGASDRLARYLGKLGLGGPWLSTFDGRPVEAAGDLSLALPVTALRNVRVKVGDAVLTGAGRHTAGEAGQRPRLEAQVAVQGLDIDDLPPLGGLLEEARGVDVGLILDATNVRQGARPGAGRVAARIASDGPALLVETLEVTDLAGANARMSGRISPDGTGRIAGRIDARRAAPLIDLLGRVWIGEASRLAPVFLREGDLALDVTLERARPGEPAIPGGRPAEAASGALSLRTTVRGRAAGGPFEADVVSAGGEASTVALRLSTDNTGRWVELPALPGLRRPSSIEIRGVRVPSGQFNVTGSADLAGVRVRTTRPFSVSPGDEVIDSGEAEISAPDVTPLLAMLGDGAGVQPPVPIRLKVSLGRERDAAQVSLSGEVAGEAVEGRFAVRSRADVAGSVTLDRLSLPWLASAFALNAPPDPKATASWSTARFGQTRRVINGGTAEVKVRRLDLGRGLVGEEAGFTFAVLPEGLAIQDLDAGLAGGRLTGGLTLTRQGSLAAVTGEGAIRNAALPALHGGEAVQGRLTASLRFGSSGESVSGLIANLAGAGEARIEDLRLPAADPAALDRALPRLLKDDDALSPGRLQAVVADELGRAPFRAASLAAPLSLVGGVARLSPVRVETPAATWQGVVSVDLKSLQIEARGALASRVAPAAWSGSTPFVTLGVRGPLAAPARELDVGPLVNGVAAIVLQRELERVEAFEQESNERNRRTQRFQMDRERRNWEIARRAAEEEARRAAEEEARRAEAARRAAEEAARREEAQRRAAEEAARRAAEEARVRAVEEAAAQARLKERQAAEEAARQLKLRQQAEAERIRAAREQADAARKESIAREPPLQRGGAQDGAALDEELRDRPRETPSGYFSPAPFGAPLQLQPTR